MGTHDDLRWHNDGRPARPKRQPCSIQPCDACVEDGIVPDHKIPVHHLGNGQYAFGAHWDGEKYVALTREDFRLPTDYSIDLRDQVEAAVKANQGSIGNTTDAVMDVLKAWIGEHCDVD